MDAPEEDLDIKLQKVSGDLISAFDEALVPFLRKSDGAGGTQVRSRVRWREQARLVHYLLDPFQELPQLLDPHLSKWLPVLAATFLEYLQVPGRAKVLSTRSDLLLPLPTAVCKILYTFCKIRGEKIIVGFLNVEAKYLELLLSALEEAEEARPNIYGHVSTVNWNWEERYVVLLWLSQLFLAPFDLATISSMDIDDEDLPVIPGLQWPANVPGIAIRVLPLAIKYISSPGKERDAAKALLVRIAMRKDMQELGILHALVQWALFSLRPRSDEPRQLAYHYIGILSFLAGVLIASSDASDMDRYLTPIFDATQAITANEGSVFDPIISTAPARKMIIKVVRSIATQILRKSQQDMAGMELVETTIGYLLESLPDNDTPVRFAASKALSIVTLKLEPDMASQVIDAVLESLNRNVLWIKNASDPTAPRTRDLTSVDPLEWHGLMLTLSHLLYRRSPPADKLPDIVHAILLGLSFEKRGTSGSSTGTNVRDAACFGIWALARRYSTAELLAVPTKSVSTTSSRPPAASILQIIATELVVTASLDPAGNIRRGSSAALQELIGRHPDTVDKGIWVVQAVDYHAVALRSRAIAEVAVKATKLSAQYGTAILEALLGWRGIADAETSARRGAAAAFGTILAQLDSDGQPLGRYVQGLGMVTARLKTVQKRQVEERHGLLLSLAAVFDAFPALSGWELPGDNNNNNNNNDNSSITTASALRGAVDALRGILEECKATVFRRPELIAEAASRLVVSSFPILQAAILGPGRAVASLLPGAVLVSGGQDAAAVFSRTVAAVDDAGGEVPRGILALLQDNITDWLTRLEDDVIAAASEAALVLLVFSGKEDEEERGVVVVKGRGTLIREWADKVGQITSSLRTGAGFGFFFALAMAHPILPHMELGGEDNALICRTILERWRNDKRIETRVALLQALTRSEVLREDVGEFLGLIEEGLDDYTTNAKGDVGSHVRRQAIIATKSLWRSVQDAATEDEALQQAMAQLFLRVLRLAAEKLDRVRAEAHMALTMALQPSPASRLAKSTFSSRLYFKYLLSLLTLDHLHPFLSAPAKSSPTAWMDALMAGLVTSADTGNEDLVIAARAALTEHCAASLRSRDRVCTALMRNLKAYQGQDRVVVPTLEIVAFLGYVDLWPRGNEVVDMRGLCLWVQKSGFKTGNVRKLEACVRVYGAVAGMGVGARQGDDDGDGDGGDGDDGQEAGIQEARKRLGLLMYHPWPRIRSLVVDELWGLLSLTERTGAAAATEMLKGVDWGKADREQVRVLVEEQLCLS